MVDDNWDDVPSVGHPLALTDEQCSSPQYVAGWNGALRRALTAGRLAYGDRVPRGMHQEYREGWGSCMLMLSAFDRSTQVCA